MDYDLKKEEDVKEYLDNLGVEYRFNCFNEKKPDSCHLLGEYFHTIKMDFARAMKIFRSNCDENNFGRSCYKYAQLAYRGKGSEAARQEGMSYFEKGCSAGHSDACTTGGIMSLAEAKKADEQQRADLQKKGADLIHRGCEMNNSYACYFEASFYLSEESEVGYSRDMQRAFKLSEKACELGNLESCANVSQMYRKGDGVEQDLDKSLLYKSKVLEIQQQYGEQLDMQR